MIRLNNEEEEEKESIYDIISDIQETVNELKTYLVN